jgi:hypothetical protein
MKQVTISGGFHNSPPMTLHITGGRISPYQYRKIDRHMCGIRGCVCGWRGFDLSGMARDEFLHSVANAQYALWKSKN